MRFTVGTSAAAMETMRPVMSGGISVALGLLQHRVVK
jgi:hypothetical protein